MDHLVAVILITIILHEVQGNTVDPGRHLLNNTSHPPPGQQRYAYKEIILYLTPTQIRALQQGQGFIYPPQLSHAEDQHKQPYEQINPQALDLHQNGYLHPHLVHQQSLQTFQEPQTDPFVPNIPPVQNHQSESNAYNNLHSQNQKRILKPIPFFPDPNIEAPNNEPKAFPALKSQEPLETKDRNNEVTPQQLKEQWLHLLKQNIAHFKALGANQLEKSNENKINYHFLSQNDHNHAMDVYNLVRANNEHRFEKQNALLQAEAIANSPPILVHKEINVKHTPAHLIAHVPVPTPFKLKNPREYEVPLDILRTVPIPITRAPGNEVDRPAPVGIEKQIPLPLTNNVYVDRPFFVERVATLKKPLPHSGTLPIHSHEWHH